MDLAHEWAIRPDTLYMNHGSFGPPPRPVKYARRRWIDALDEQPMDFYVRRLEPAVLHAREATSAFVGTELNNLVLVENATFGMNVVADSFPLKEGFYSNLWWGTMLILSFFAVLKHYIDMGTRSASYGGGDDLSIYYDFYGYFVWSVFSKSK